MIVIEDDDRYVLVTQAAHAVLSGELAARWSGDSPRERSGFVTAARVHDNGWRESDACLSLDANGRPHSYRTLPDEPYLAVWARGIARAAALDPYVGLLVGLHGARFLRTDHSDAHRAFLVSERVRQNAVLADMEPGARWDALPQDVALDFARLAFVDSLSLFALGEFPSPLTLTFQGRKHECARQADGTVVVSPFPFSEPTESRVPALSVSKMGAVAEGEPAFNRAKRTIVSARIIHR